VRSSILAPALAAILVACTGAGTRPGDACSSAKPCSDGQVCDLTDPGGAACLDGGGDVDGDGIANQQDFCNHAPGGGYDEDADGFGDECDACPISRPPTKADADGDAVDSPCDPDTSTAGDKIVVFNGFNTALPTGTSSAWTVSNGEAVMTPVNPATLEQLTVKLPTPSNRVTILAAYRVEATPAAPITEAGVTGLSILPMGNTVVRCGATRSLGDQLRTETNAGIRTVPAQNLFDPTSRYRLAQQIVGAQVNCALIGDREQDADQAASNGENMIEVGLYARGSAIRFSYILVVQR
jgi:hypothetical protein